MTVRPSHEEALSVLQGRVSARPRDARLRLAIGQTLQHLGRPVEALSAYEQALAIDEHLGTAWSLRGHLLRQAGRLADASVCFNRAIACGEDAASHRYFLGALGLGDLPAAAPPAFVQALFDEYADGFERDLVETLHYRGHLEVTAPLSALRPQGFEHALDLGCGSGLAAPLLRPLVRRLVGVDLSERMLARAEASGLYDELVQADLLTFLRGESQPRDLIVCCDVFIYIGNLKPVFDAVTRALAPGGVFGLSVEAGQADGGYDLLPTLRYTHSEPYLRRLAAEAGLQVARCVNGPLREGHGEPVDGSFMHLQRV